MKRGEAIDRAFLDVLRNGGGVKEVRGTLEADADGIIEWTPEEGPYHLVRNVTVPSDATLIIAPGTSVYADRNRTLTVRGILQAVGTKESRIRFTSLPGAPFVSNPAGNGGLPDGPPKWGGIRFQGSLSSANILSYADVENAQHERGSVGAIESEVIIERCSFRGTHLRMVYAERSSMIVRFCDFPDMFAEDERPSALGLDNISEHIKSTGRYPDGGHFIIECNTFGTNKGHNDVIDTDSGLRPNPILQVRNNVFRGAGDEQLDLGGDVYLEGNVFFNIFKDDETSDRGYANGISTGDAVSNATVVAARNVFWDVDHAINLKRGTATLFENNSIYKVHGDFEDRFGNPNVGSVINLYVDEPGATAGDGAFVSGNIFNSIPRIFGNADLPRNRVSDLEFTHNFVDPAMEDATVGKREDVTVFDLGPGNVTGTPAWVDPDNGDFRLVAGSAAIGTGPLGRDFGAMVAGGAWIAGEPAFLTSSTVGNLTFGGPGIFAVRYRINDQPWSDPVRVGNGFDPESGTVRVAEVALEGLVDGTYTVSAIGQDFSGVWQAEDSPTVSRTWTVNTTERLLWINEVLADNRSAAPHQGEFPDYVELFNAGSTPIDLSGMALTDDPSDLRRFIFAPGTEIPAGSYLVLYLDSAAGFALNDGGEAVHLFESTEPGSIEVDAIQFGIQIPDFSIGRSQDGKWELNKPTPGARNQRQITGDPNGIRINEWVSHGEVLFDSDWIELSNSASVPVALDALSIGDEHSYHAQPHSFAALSFIAPDGYAKLYANRQTHESARNLGFSLDAFQEAIILSTEQGTVTDAVFFGPQFADTSQDRTGAYSQLPTFGFANTDPPGAANANALLASLRITELHFAPEGGSELEFVELRNVGGSTLDLGGVRFVEGVDFEFPDNTLSPGAEIVVVSNLVAFRAVYGDQVPVAGEFTGNLKNSGELVVLSLPSPYDAGILRFNYEDQWVPEAATEGYSMTVLNPALPAVAWRDGDNWIRSAAIGGDPGGSPQTQPETFSEWLTRYGIADPSGDTDGDTLTELVEYAFGTNPLDPSGANGAASLPSAAVGEDTFEFAFSVPAAASLPLGHGTKDVSYVVESSTALGQWQTVNRKDPDGSWSNEDGVLVGDTADSRVALTIRIDRPPGDSARYLRLRLEQRQ